MDAKIIIFFIFAAMKSLATYLFLPLMICIYIAGTMGLGVHICDSEGSSKLLLMAGALPCHHKHMEEPHDDHCCRTLVYIIDKAQNVTDGIKVDAPVALSIAPLWASVVVPAVFALATPLFLADDIVYGPEGGLAFVAPLRL